MKSDDTVMSEAEAKSFLFSVHSGPDSDDIASDRTFVRIRELLEKQAEITAAAYTRPAEPPADKVEAIMEILEDFLKVQNGFIEGIRTKEELRAAVLDFPHEILKLCQPELTQSNPITDNLCFGCKYRKLNEPDYINICLLEGECIKEAHDQKQRRE